MYFVSRVIESTERISGTDVYYTKVGVTDTIDGVEEVISNSDLFYLIKTKKVHVYGAYCWNDYVMTTPMQVNQKIFADRLLELAMLLKELHNPWHLYQITDYLASAENYTVVEVYYQYEAYGRYKNGLSKLERLGDDSWYFTDDDNSFSNSRLTSSKAAAIIDYPLCCVKKIKVYKEKV